MNPVFKCKVCEHGPCYIQTERKADSSIYGDGDCGMPLRCPYNDEEMPEFEPVAPEANPWSLRWIDEMQEWLAGEGYEKAPEALRDGIMIDLRGRIERYEAMRITGLLREYEEEKSGGLIDREAWTRKLAKWDKWKLLQAVFPEAFKAGLIYGEMIRQRDTRMPSEVNSGMA